MSVITKANNNLLIKSDYSERYATFSNFIDIVATWGTQTIEGTETEWVQLSLDNRHGYRFGHRAENPDGPLTSVNGIDVTAFTAQEIIDLINSSVLTPDQFSGTPLIIDDTNTHTGSWLAIMPLEDTVLNATNTVQVDGSGNPITVSGYTGITLSPFVVIYGHFTSLDLVSGSLIAYSNL